MSNDIQTVKIAAETPSGYAVINEQDYDASRHVLYADPGDPPPDLPESAYALDAQPLEAPKRRGRPPKDTQD